MIIQIIFFLIKLIGTILLVLLGVLAFLLLVILLVPIRYRVRLSHGEKFHMEGTVSWLLHIVHGRITQKGELRRIILRIFGFVIYDSDRPKKPPKIRTTQKRTQWNDKKKSKNSHSRSHGPAKRNRGEAIYKADIKNKIPDSEANRLKTQADVDRQTDEYSKMQNNPSCDITERQNNGKAMETHNNPNTEATETRTNPKTDSYEDKIAETLTWEFKEDQEQLGLFSKILRRIREFFHRIKQFFRGLKERVKSLLQKALDLKHKINLIKEFITEEENREAFHITFGSLRKLLKHILPTKLRSRLTFGTGDPCTTGQALGLMGFLYGFYGEHIQINPDFENKVFEGSHYARGRIRIGTLLIIVTKLLLDKKFKLLRRNFKILKEAL